MTYQSTSLSGWHTNDERAAAILRKADVAYDAAELAARDLCLAAKVTALREARKERDAAYHYALG